MLLMMWTMKSGLGKYAQQQNCLTDCLTVDWVHIGDCFGVFVSVCGVLCSGKWGLVLLRRRGVGRHY